MDFSAIERGKLTQKEFGILCGVSRVTVNLWVRNKMQPHRYIRQDVERTISLLNQAIDQGQLPLAHALTPDQRVEALREMVSENLELTN